MTTSIYETDLGFDKLQIRCDFCQASSPIEYKGYNGWVGTPFQCADAYHGVVAAFVLVIKYLGQEYWGDPSEDSDGRDDDALIEDMVKAAGYEYIGPMYLYKLFDNEDTQLVDIFEDMEDVECYIKRHERNLAENERYQVQEGVDGAVINF